MPKACLQCGAAFTPQRSTAKYCSHLCRTKASQARQKAPGGGTVVPLSKGSRPPGKPAKASAASAPACSVTEATRAQLGDLASSVLGQTALVLAKRLDDGTDTGSAMATMVKQLNALMASLPVDAGEAEDPVLKARQALAERRARLA